MVDGVINVHVYPNVCYMFVTFIPSSCKINTMALVNIWKSSFTRDTELTTYIIIIWLLTAMCDIELVVVNTQGEKNLRDDLLSRFKSCRNNVMKLHKQVYKSIWHIIVEHLFQVNYDI